MFKIGPLDQKKSKYCLAWRKGWTLKDVVEKGENC